VALGLLPAWTLIALGALLPAVPAARSLLELAEEPARLAPAIKQTIAAAHLSAVLTAVGLLLAGRAG
jgi:1,4-dihydroxy-2-naphthoate octaprenyltransferase